jgi:FkbM family methyltransferase
MKLYLKSLLSNFWVALSYLYNFRNEYWRPTIIRKIDRIILDCIEQKNEFSFIQIGSNDGKSNDPLFYFIKNYKCRGVLIEPVKYIFDQLKENYQDIQNVHFENNAVSNNNFFQDFYSIIESTNAEIPKWYKGLSSFKLDTILSHKNRIPNLEKLIVKQNIQPITFQSILDKYRIKNLDILHIDNEGFDYEIIKTINFFDFCPAILLFESKHLSDTDYKTCLKSLRVHYKTIRRNKGDTICYNLKKEFVN